MPWWDSGFETEAQYNAHNAAQQETQNAAPQRWDQYVQQAGGIDKVAPSGSQLDSQIRGGYLPEVRALPGGQMALANTHWDGGSTSYTAPDGRTVLDRFGPETGHWDNPTRENLGYTLRDTDAKTAAGWGVTPTPEMQQRLGDKKLNRWENYDTAGKSQGYGYELADDRNFFQQFIQDLGPVLMAPVMGAVSPMLAGGIQSLTGLSPALSQTLGGGLLGGTVSKLGGGDFVKGAVTGGLGSAISAYNPAAAAGVSEVLQKPVNTALTSAGRAALSGQSIDDALMAQLKDPSFLLAAAGRAGGVDLGGWSGALQLANAVASGNPMAIMQAVKLVTPTGKAGGGLIPDGVPDKVEAARMLASLPQEYRPMLSGIASNLMKG